MCSSNVREVPYGSSRSRVPGWLLAGMLASHLLLAKIIDVSSVPPCLQNLAVMLRCMSLVMLLIRDDIALPKKERDKARAVVGNQDGSDHMLPFCNATSYCNRACNLCGRWGQKSRYK
eukprot:2699313-Amphidinium_carterae.1